MWNLLFFRQQVWLANFMNVTHCDCNVVSFVACWCRSSARRDFLARLLKNHIGPKLRKRLRLGPRGPRMWRLEPSDSKMHPRKGVEGSIHMKYFWLRIASTASALQRQNQLECIFWTWTHKTVLVIAEAGLKRTYNYGMHRVVIYTSCACSFVLLPSKLWDFQCVLWENHTLNLLLLEPSFFFPDQQTNDFLISRCLHRLSEHNQGEGDLQSEELERLVEFVMESIHKDDDDSPLISFSGNQTGLKMRDPMTFSFFSSWTVCTGVPANDFHYLLHYKGYRVIF